MKNIWLWVGIACLVVGSVFACFTNIANDIPALAVAAFGLGTVIINTWNKSDKKDWKVIVSVVCVAVGGFCCAFAALSQEVMVQIVSAVIALVTLIIGVLIPVFSKKAD